LIETWNELAKYLVQNPEKLINSQLNYWKDYQTLYQQSSQNEEETFDKRFKHEEWQNNISFNFLKKSYILLSKHIENLISDFADKENTTIVKKLQFFARQYIDSIAPTNFANANPEVLAKMIETNGENIVTGFRQLLKDLEDGEGHL